MQSCMYFVFVLVCLNIVKCASGVSPIEIEEELNDFVTKLQRTGLLQREFNVDADLYESLDEGEDTVPIQPDQSRRKRALGWGNWLTGRQGGSRADRQGGFGAQNLGGLGLAGYTYNLINTIRLLSQGLGLGYLERVSSVVREVDSYDCIPRAICEYTANQTYNSRLAEQENEKQATGKGDNSTTNATSTERPWYSRFAPRPENIPQYLTVVRALNLDQTNSFHLIRPAMFGVHKARVSDCLSQYKECNGSYSDAFIETVNNMDGGIVGALSRIGGLLGVGNNAAGAAAQPSAASLFSAAGLGSIPSGILNTAGAALSNGLAPPLANGLGQAANPFGAPQQANGLTREQAQYYQQLLLAQQQQQQQAAQGGNFDLSPLILRGVNALRGALSNRSPNVNPSGVPSLQDLINDSDDLDPNDFDFESRNNDQLRGGRGIAHRIPSRFDDHDPHPNAIPRTRPVAQPVRYAPTPHYQPVRNAASGVRKAEAPRQQPDSQQVRGHTHATRENARPVPYRQVTQINANKNILQENRLPQNDHQWHFFSDPTAAHRRAVQGQKVNPAPAAGQSRGRQSIQPTVQTGKVMFRD